ncbi:MAG: YkgJ family cysteine cluster protein, partial [Desulfobulbaceae bacterium]|nr:YkgJ family cysteine cluster protein [Desulfobulbaceae bacterium]
MQNAPRREILSRVYEIHEEWLYSFTWACHEGCASCCTQSVTMTTLEGQRMVEFLADHGRLGELAALASAPSPPETVPLTFNGFARHCLAGEEPAEPTSTDWDFTPCPFLADNRCTVYPARPMGCRAFVSKSDCGRTGSAEVEPLVITINTIFLQFIEHLDQRGYWGRMIDILAELDPQKEQPKMPGMAKTPQEAAKGALRVAEPLEGFLVPPEEQTAVEPLFQRIMACVVEGQPIGEWLGLAGHD